MSKDWSEMDAILEVRVQLDKLLEERGMTLASLAKEVDVTVVNLSVLKNNRAKAIRFSTLSAICAVLNCQPGDILTVEPCETNPADA